RAERRRVRAAAAAARRRRARRAALAVGAVLRAPAAARGGSVTVGVVATIALHDLKVMLKEKETLLWLFVMPVVFFWFLGTMQGGSGGRRADGKDQLGVLVPDDAGPLADRLLARLERENFEVHRVADAAALQPFERRLAV